MYTQNILEHARFRSKNSTKVPIKIAITCFIKEIYCVPLKETLKNNNKLAKINKYKFDLRCVISKCYYEQVKLVKEGKYPYF